jgi:hypothetical protein
MAEKIRELIIWPFDSLPDPERENVIGIAAFYH